MTTIAVIVPTVAGREEQFARCLAALDRQVRPADQVIVVRDAPSYVGALRQGWQDVRCDWVALLDDDAEPMAEWLALMEQHLGDETVGAVGGRILNVVDGRTTARNYDNGAVAKLTWFGKTHTRLHDIPAHRRLEEVDFLPGANMCVRHCALPEIPARLDFRMAPGFELAVCLGLKRKGWRVLFDSDLLVIHYPAARPVSLRREDRARYAREYSRTTTYAVLRGVAWPRRLAFIAYFFLIGQRESPGIALAPLLLLRPRARRRFVAAWRGKVEGFLSACAVSD